MAQSITTNEMTPSTSMSHIQLGNRQFSDVLFITIIKSPVNIQQQTALQASDSELEQHNKIINIHKDIYVTIIILCNTCMLVLIIYRTDEYIYGIKSVTAPQQMQPEPPQAVNPTSSALSSLVWTSDRLIRSSVCHTVTSNPCWPATPGPAQISQNFGIAEANF